MKAAQQARKDPRIGLPMRPPSHVPGTCAAGDSCDPCMPLFVWPALGGGVCVCAKLP